MVLPSAPNRRKGSQSPFSCAGSPQAGRSSMCDRKVQDLPPSEEEHTERRYCVYLKLVGEEMEGTKEWCRKANKMRPEGKASGMALSRSEVPSFGKRVTSPRKDQEAPESIDTDVRRTRSVPSTAA